LVDRSCKRSSRVWSCVAAAAVAAAALNLAACARKAEEEIASAEVPTITAEIGSVARQDLIEPLVVRGGVVALPNQDVKIASLVAGRVDSMSVAEGDFVKAGQVVAEIDPRPFADQRRQAAAALAQARGAMENATLNLDRTERLFQRGIAAGKEVEDARTLRASAVSSVEQAQAALDTADRQLQRTKIVSPISGQVVKRLVAVGEQVDGTAGQAVLEVANLDQVEIAANIPAEHLVRVRVGQAAAVSSDAYGERVFAGQVIAIAPSVDAATNAALARVRVANPDRLLKVGMFARVHIALSERKGALTVPPSAVSKGEEGPAVYVVDKQMATRTKVTLGLETAGAVEIQAGLTEGQKILTSAIHGLGEQARLAPRK
jgi:RND family efflux transporter MFP subunit